MLKYNTPLLPYEKSMAKLMNLTVDEWNPFIEKDGSINMRRNPEFRETDEIQKLRLKADLSWDLHRIWS